MGVIVLGIDGLGYEGLKFLNKIGFLSDISYLAKRHTHATSRTCFPPQTIPAWISLFTGVNPGKHGIFSFLETTRNGVRINTSSNIRFPPIYEIFALQRKPFALINVPLSYPFHILYGIGISDWLSPIKRISINLKEHKNIIRDIVNEYVFPDAKFKKHIMHREKIHRALSELEKRFWTIEGLLEIDAIENFFVVISELDWIFHTYYHRIIQGNISKNIRKILILLDKKISKILKLANKRNLDIIIVSDHGFKTYRKLVSVGDILRKYRLARGISIRIVSGKRRKKMLKTITKHKTSPRILFLKAFWELTISSKITRINPKKVYDTIIRSNYRVLQDSKKSPAFVMLNIPAFFIAINKKVKKHRKILINFIIKKLKSLRDHEGNPIFSLVKKRESLYWGPYVKKAPHIGIFGNTNKGYLTSAILTGATIISRRTNYHDFDAIFIAKSEHISRGSLGQVSIYDIAPTIMSINNIPLQKGLDGIPLTNKRITYTNYISRWRIARGLRIKHFKT